MSEITVMLNGLSENVMFIIGGVTCKVRIALSSTKETGSFFFLLGLSDLLASIPSFLIGCKP